MTREEAKKILGEDATEAQITALLNNFHKENEEKEKLQKQIEKLEKEKEKLADSNVELKEYKNKYDVLEKANMTKEQLLEAREKELEEKVKTTSMLNNSIKAKSILVGAGVDEKEADELVASIVKEDEATTLASAQLLANSFKALEEKTTKKTKEDLLTADVKPNSSNVQGDSKVTKDDFLKLSPEEQNKFIEENSEAFYNL